MSETDSSREFVDHLKTLDAAALAELRRSLSFPPGEYSRAFPYVERMLKGKNREMTYLLAGLYALKERAPEKSLGIEPSEASAEIPKGPTLGWSVAQLAEKDGKVSPSTAARFVHLLDAQADELHNPLRQMIALIKAQDKPVHWVRLLDDLRSWSRFDKRVQRNWAQDFYKNPTPPEVQV